MHAKRLDSNPLPKRTAAAAPVANVASGGVVADWHRAIEHRYAPAPVLEDDSRGEVMLRGVSRVAGWCALLAAYATVTYLIFG